MPGHTVMFIGRNPVVRMKIVLILRKIKGRKRLGQEVYTLILIETACNP